MSLTRGSLVILAAVTGVMFAAPPSARADSIDFLGMGRHAAVSATLKVGTTTYTRNVYAGELRWMWQGLAPGGEAGDFYSYCIDLLNFVRDPQVVTITSSTGFTNGATNGGAKAAWLFNTYAPTIHASGTGTQAAALQVAIWDAMYDDAKGLAAGNFRLSTSGTLRTYADQYLSALYSASPYHTSVATVLATTSGQDQIIEQVDEPATLAAYGAGLIVLSVFLRRKTIETS